MFTLCNTGSDPNIAGGNQYAEGGLAVARGQAIFNTRKITITGVSGLNDELGAASIEGTQDCGLRIGGKVDGHRPLRGHPGSLPLPDTPHSAILGSS